MPDTDSDADPDSPSHRPAPQTPIGNANAEHHPWLPRHDHDAATPNKPSPSPSGSPSLILHSLGMSTFSTMRRQLSSPFTRSPSSPLHLVDAEQEEHEEIVRDSKDVLVQRLNDLAAQLSEQDHLKEDSVNGLHAKVDEMERVLSARNNSSRRRSQRARPSSLVLQSSASSHDSLWGMGTPGQIMPNIPSTPLPTLRSSSTQTTDRPVPNASRSKAANGSLSSTEANRVVEMAQNLSKELESVITNLRARQEESDHIHEMLIMRAERAAQRIIYLEKRIKELERERNEGEMELFNLQIQLKAIEVQCMSYVPEGTDEDLRESISAWKTEWSTMKRKKARRNLLDDASEDSSAPMTPQRRIGESEDLKMPATPIRPQRNKAAPG
ncbi:hypothetical protein GGR53DRAFT_200560 [Hypoxylon sp. FL1150]|nr:hypothetical protein GGR53DRAFT_200560 [Hypoxylon sp. FL1150]